MILKLRVNDFLGMEIVEAEADTESPGRPTAGAPTARLMPKMRTVDRDYVLFRAGDIADTLYILHSGAVRVLGGEEGDQDSGRILRSPCTLGEAALHGYRHPYSAICVEHCELEEYRASEVLKVSGAAAAVMVALARQASDLWRQKASRGRGGTWERLIKELTELANQDGALDEGGWVTIRRPITHAFLASLIGAARESVTIQLGKMKKEGAVDVRGKYLAVNPTRLQSLLKPARSGLKARTSGA